MSRPAWERGQHRSITCKDTRCINNSQLQDLLTFTFTYTSGVYSCCMSRVMHVNPKQPTRRAPRSWTGRCTVTLALQWCRLCRTRHHMHNCLLHPQLAPCMPQIVQTAVPGLPAIPNAEFDGHDRPKVV